jgi:hypothetical protein
MKLGNPANYYARVRYAGWDDTAERSGLYRGVYAVELNEGMDLMFIDDLTRYGPPWRESSLPPEEDGDLVDPDMVRPAQLLQSQYAVTPNDSLAGRAERFDRPWPSEENEQAVVFYVSQAEFAPLIAELEALADTDVGNNYPTVRRDQMLSNPVIHFVEDRILTSPLLAPFDAWSFGRAPRPDLSPGRQDYDHEDRDTRELLRPGATLLVGGHPRAGTPSPRQLRRDPEHVAHHRLHRRSQPAGPTVAGRHSPA